jgi:hypothetical protein
MASAGPIGNFLIALAALLALRSGLVMGLFIAPETVSFDSLVETATGPTFLTTALSVLLIPERLHGHVQSPATATAGRSAIHPDETYS